jgi:hypothetical protein
LLSIAAPSRSLAQVICGWTRPLGRSLAGDDVFLADEISERYESIGYQFRVLDEIGGVADDTRNQDLASGEFHVAPNFDFMFATDVAIVENVKAELAPKALHRELEHVDGTYALRESGETYRANLTLK